METMQITIAHDMKEFLQAQASKRGFATPNEYVQALLVDLQQRAKDRKSLEEKLLEGVRTPKVPGDDAFWRERRRKIFDKHPELDPCNQTTPESH